MQSTGELREARARPLTRLLRERLGPYRRTVALMLFLQAVQTSASLVLPTLNARIIDHGILPHDEGYIRRTGAVMLGFSLIQICFAVAAVYLGAKVAMSFGRDIRGAMFHQVTAFSAREVGTFGAPSLITRITNDVQQVQMLVVMAATMAIAAPITMVVGIVAATRQDLGLSAILVVSVPVAAGILGLLVSQMVPAFRLMQERIDQINRVLREQITGIRVVRAFVREPQERARFAVANAELTDTSLRASRLMAAMFPTVNLVINASSVAVLWLGAGRIQAGHMQVGSLVAYLSYLIQILMSVVMATFMISMIPRASVSAGRIQEVVDTRSTVVAPSSPRRPGRGELDVEFRDVGFHYPGAEHSVLTGISFSTLPGQMTAIVGSTGAGKTTLLQLVPRLFDATQGSVMVGGMDVRELDTRFLWSVVGLVPQRPYLFSGTVASNLAYGKPDADERDMWEALEVAQAADFVRAMPGALEARIDQGGTNVSGGQRQRLAIARALVRKPDIYLFDDSFSALDLSTDARLRAALKPYTASSVVLIVAQRVSTIVSADRIVVLEDGEIVGMGTDAELRAGCPTYAEIVQSQLGEREPARRPEAEPARRREGELA
ncbi:MAG TPA: ABC transporter ATP-binding protein [Acidimicrobiales bacterium]|nr:ABC transporter ATP-binding protein [Acidimicrobiales bacterium]